MLHINANTTYERSIIVHKQVRSCNQYNIDKPNNGIWFVKI